MDSLGQDKAPWFWWGCGREQPVGWPLEKGQEKPLKRLTDWRGVEGRPTLLLSCWEGLKLQFTGWLLSWWLTEALKCFLLTHFLLILISSFRRAPTATFHDSKHNIVHVHFDATRGWLLTSGTDKVIKVGGRGWL